MKLDMKRALPDMCCIALLAVIAWAYFMAPVSKGYRLEQHDNGAGDGVKVEIDAFRDAHGGETPRWITSLFGGMPTYQFAPSYDSQKAMTFVEKAYHLWFPDYVWYIFASMLGFYILLRAFDFRQWMAALGAVVWAFSSYFFIIIAAGHIWKVMTLAYIPPTIAGIVLCYRKKYLLGTIVTALFATLQIQANHVQMSYYFLTVELAVVIAFLIQAIRKRELAVFGKATAGVALAAVLAICLNASNLYHTYEYAKDTMRGKSELVKKGKAEDQTDSGLERSYITAWSYGIGESMTFLIPDVKGGASVPLSMNKTAMKKADPQLEQMGIYGAFTQYWGEQPGTSGPVYLGALVCMLFVMSLFVIPNRHPLKWTLLAAGLLTLMLGWGKNFMPFTDWFIDHVPMYSKFRTVASILVVVEFVVPFMALWGLKLWVEKPSKKPLYIATVFTVVICLLYAMAPGMGSDLLSSNDRAAVQQYVEAGYFDEAFGKNILRSISDMRAAMVSADAWRSILFILLGAAALWWYGKKKEKTLSPALPHHEEGGHAATWLSVALLVVCLIDMWQVNKRYLHDSMFVEPQGVARIQKTDADKYILEKSGTGRDYRVLNFTVSTFNDNSTSAFYSSVGGYHAAKLRRYQELIEAHLQQEIQTAWSLAPTMEKADSLLPVLNMLNMKYMILPLQDGGKTEIKNPHANGNAWFVSEVRYVEDADAELAGLKGLDTKHVAVADKKFEPVLGKATEDSTATVVLANYEANELQYDVESREGGVLVFSEIYYPGWTCTVDGQAVEIGRVNYVLRAVRIDGGKHHVVLTFKPKSERITETIAYSALGLLALLFVGLLVRQVVVARRKA